MPIYLCPYLFTNVTSILFYCYLPAALDFKSLLPSGIARCFTFGGNRNRVLHDPSIHPRSDLSKEQYIDKDKQTTINHFHEKLLKLKDLMKTQVHKIFL